jgi:hypothetical protein
MDEVLDADSYSDSMAPRFKNRVMIGSKDDVERAKAAGLQAALQAQQQGLAAGGRGLARGAASRAALSNVTPGPAVQAGTTGRTPTIPASPTQAPSPAKEQPAATSAPAAGQPPTPKPKPLPPLRSFVPKVGPIQVFRPINPGESYLDYGQAMHQHGLKRYFELRYPDAKVTMNTRPGVTGPDVEVTFENGRAPLNFRFGELKTIRTPINNIQSQVEFNWGYEMGEGRFFFYDRRGYMMEGVVDRPTH